jgi:hypothetical protein
MEPLIHHFAKINAMPSDLIDSANDKVIYDPATQLSKFEMGSYSTSCHKSTDGTGTKNEADRVMDDN